MINNCKKLSLLTLLAAVLYSSSVYSQTLVVARGKFKVVWDDRYSGEDSQLVADTVTTAAREAGWTVEKVDKECTDMKCLSELAKEKKADNAVYVTTSQDSSMYEFKIILLNGEGITHTKTGPFSLVMEDLSKVVKDALGTPPQEEEPVPNEEPAPLEEQPVEETQPEDDRKPLKIFFGVSTGLTLSSMIAGAFTTGAALKSKERLEEPDEWSTLTAWNNEKDRYDKLAISSWVLWSATGVFAITSVTLGIFAFKKDEKEVVIGLPVISDDSAMLVITGRF